MKQIIVTKKGQGIIPRALANGEVIKFTRVCISDKDYSGVELCNLESIENVKQEVNVDRVHIINDTQIEIVCGVDNEKLNDAYYIRTIGIYAEDSKGNEILYGVSVSEDTPKYMPKYEGKTLTGILYRLTINIDNAESVITDINNATVANVLEVQLIEKRVSAVENRVGIVENDIRQLAKPNLLINSNFKVSEIVNQRGESTYSKFGYTFDMWQLVGTSTNGEEINLNDKYVVYTKYSNDTIRSIFNHFIENAIYTENITISFKISGMAGKKVKILRRVGGAWSNTTHTLNGGDEILTATFSAINGLDAIQIEPLDAQTLKMYYIKAEIGTIATPFVDDDYTTKLLKCSRYLTKIPADEHIRMNISVGPNLYFNTKLPVPMRVTPTIINPNEISVFSVVRINTHVPETGYNILINGYKDNSILFRCVKTGNTLTDASIKMYSDMLLSAEI